MSLSGQFRPVWFASLALATALLAGCSSSSEKSTSASADKPAELSGPLEVVAFKGGYGIDQYEKAAKEFGEKHPGLEIKVAGDPRVWEQLRPRLVAGNPPDLMFPGWDMDVWGLIEEEQLKPLDEALDQPAADGTGTWRDTFDPNVLKLGQKDGKTYLLPYYVMTYGWWHDPGLFAKNGWKVPATYPELLTLCEKIKAKGVAPITYQGQYPYYMIEGMLLPWAASIGGIAAVNAAQNLEPGAWKSPAMLQAATMIDDLNKKGYLQAGAVGMSHTESQTQFLNGKAAMIPCGSWLQSEMEKSIPKGVKLEFFLPPTVPSGVGDPTAVLIGVEPWMVPTDAKNPTAAIELFRYMTSLPKAKEFTETKGTLMAIKGSDEVKLPEVLVKPAAAMKSANTLWSNQFRSWYKAAEKDIEGALTSLLNGQITPAEFTERCEAAAEKTRNDKSIAKYKVS
jgi:N-acetylglucosamine transport system substrate-binding protein